MYKGLDISYFQSSNINWNSIANEGYSFVFIKAGEGNKRIEPLAHAQAIGAKNAGLKIGYYFFSHPEEDTGQFEANFFYSILKNLPTPDLLPVLDIEINKSNLNSNQMTSWMEGFVTTLKQYYPNVIIYSYTPFLNSVLLPSAILAPTKLWLAQYINTPLPKLPIGYTKYDIWQYTNKGSVNGINGSVDLNICADINSILI